MKLQLLKRIFPISLLIILNACGGGSDNTTNEQNTGPGNGIDSIAPQIAIVTPTSNPNYSQNTDTINISGTSTDNIGVIKVDWTNDRGGSGQANLTIGTDNWDISNISLFPGSNIIKITAYDNSNNSKSATLNVNFSNNGIDSIAPQIVIITPTSNPNFSLNTNTINISGTSTDNTGVIKVDWTNNRGGSGLASLTSGTDNWNISNISLLPGSNIIKITAYDSANNNKSATLIVTYDVVTQAKDTLYVAKNGDDTLGDGTLANPFITISKASKIVIAGQNIVVRAGTYCGATLSKPGTNNAWITLKPFTGESVIIESCGRNETLYFYNDAFSAMYWIVEGFEVRGGNIYVIKVDTPNVKIIGNNLHGSNRDIIKVVSTANDAVIMGNEIHDNNAVNGANAQGIDITGADRVLVSNNYVHDIPSIGMYAKGNARNTIFENNLLMNIYERGIMLGQSTDAFRLLDGNYESYDGIIRNNVILNTGEACLASASSFNVKIYNNSCYQAATRAHGAIYLSNESEVFQAGTNIEIKNNIIYASTNTNRPVIKVGSNALTDSTTLDIDQNIYWSTTGASSVTFLWGDRNLDNVSFAAWKAATAQDSSSIVADPLYNNLMELTISATSPARDSGINTNLVQFDYTGAIRPFNNITDIGAYEFGSSPP